VVRANRFAQVALRNLQSATPQWRRASDIEVITAPLAAKATKRGPDARRRVNEHEGHNH
jgi:hypothetical protein